MFVKWNGEISETMDLNGGGPQGALWGILEYLSLSNDNTSHIPLKEKYKYIDDLSILEKVNLLCIGLSSYNFKSNVASDIIQDGYFLHPENLQTQTNLDRISEWTKKKQMPLNIGKIKTNNFNFTKNFQFPSRLTVEGQVL